MPLLVTDPNASTFVPEFEVNEDTTPILTAQLKDSDGTNLTLVNLDTITLTLFIPKTGQIVNSRNAQDIKNTNGVTISATGLLTWTMAAADTAILISDTDNTMEIHRALFEFVRVTTGLRGKKLVDIVIKNLAQVP